MDPTPEELALIASLDQARQWAGVDGDLNTSLMAALGDPQRVREISLVPRPVWDAVVATVQVPDGGDPRVPPPGRFLNAIEQARVESLR